MKGIWICAGLVTAVVALSAVTNTYTHTYIIEKIGISGWVIDSSGYTEFFLLAAVLGIPAIVLVLVLMRHARHEPPAAVANGPLSAP